MLVEKTIRAAQQQHRDIVCIAGGVAANSGLRQELAAACERAGLRLLTPDLRFCTDNAVMIGSRAFYQYEAGQFADWTLNADPRLPFRGTI